MPMDRFIIAPFDTGLQTNVKPWLIQDDAFSQLKNAYVFRGRVKKRFGSRYTGSGWESPAVQQLNSRVSVKIGTTSGIGGLSGTVPGATFAVGQAFSIGSQMYTVQATGTPVTMLTTGAGSGTYNTSNGAYVFTGAPINTDVYFYPSTPIMGIYQYQVGSINTQPTYAFDTQFVYTYTSGAWLRPASSPVWHGTDDQFFWASTWRGAAPDLKAFFVTNFNATVPTPALTDDPMYYFDGTNWNNFSTATVFLTAGNYVQTARLIIPFRNRLLLLNTIETNAANNANKAYVNRCRYSHNGSPFSATAWLEPNNTNGGQVADGAGFIDAPTEEQIVSAGFIKDRLIVYFERSTWELAYTGNQVLPFVWQKLNTELGSESQLSSVPFDKQLLTIGNTGVHACNGSNVERIDNNIPQQVFDIQDVSSGVERVSGIRDYFSELVYWTFPQDNQVSFQYFPGQVLVYNYKNESWALNDDCITVFGYFNSQDSMTWEEDTDTWQEASYSWESGTLDANFRQVIGGNQQGYIFLIDSEVTRNAGVQQISNITLNSSNLLLTVTCVNHMMQLSANGGFVHLENVQGMTNINGIYPIFNVLDANRFQVLVLDINNPPTGTYRGAGTAARVSQINVYSKQWNPYVEKGRNVFVQKIDFSVTRTAQGKVTIDYFPSSSDLSSIESGDEFGTNMLLGTSVLETSPYALYRLESTQERLWHPVYFQTDGECIQIRIYLSPEQMVNEAIVYSDFELHGMVLSTMPTSERLQ